jgi:hypothetical protein
MSLAGTQNQLKTKNLKLKTIKVAQPILPHFIYQHNLFPLFVLPLYAKRQTLVLPALRS